MAFPAVTDLFKGTIDESLKKLVQPAAIVPASVFVLLNLAVIYPALLDAGVGPAAAFDKVDDTFKFVLVTGAILILGYVLLNLNGSVLRLATGELLADTPLGTWLTNREQARITAFRVRLQAQPQGARLSAKAEDTRLPPTSKAAPTRLGNVFAGASWALADRYGFDLAATWVHLEAVLKKDQDKLGTALDDERAPMEVLLSLAAVVLVFGIEAAAVSLLIGNPADALLLLATLPIAYGLYRAACARAASYVDLMKAAVDLFRGELGTKLGIAATTDNASQKAAWQETARWFLYNIPPDTGPDPSSPPTITTTSPDNVSIKALTPSRINPRTTRPAEGGVRAEWTVRYGWLVTSKLPDECCKEDLSTQLILSAGKVWRWHSEPPPVGLTVRGQPRVAEPVSGGAAGDSLLVRLDLSGSASTDVLLAYTPALQLDLLEKGNNRRVKGITARFVGGPDLGDAELTFELRNSAKDREVRLVFFCDWAGDLPPLFFVGEETLTPRALKPKAWAVEASIAKGTSQLVVKLIDVTLKRVEETTKKFD